jgi:hypothetical protein
MERREFLKLSVLFGTIAVDTSSTFQIIKNIVYDDRKIHLYLMQRKNGKWKIRWTKHTDLNIKKINIQIWKIETFKFLETVDFEIANNRRAKLWKKYNCSGETGAPISIEKPLKAAQNMLKSSNLKEYMNSEKKQKQLKDRSYKGGKVWGPTQGKHNVESGLWKEIQIAGTYAFVTKYAGSKEQREWGSKGGKRAYEVNVERGNMKKLAQHKIKLNRARWKTILDQIKTKTFTRADIARVSTNKISFNIINSELVKYVSGHGVPFDPKIFIKNY